MEWSTGLVNEGEIAIKVPPVPIGQTSARHESAIVSAGRLEEQRFSALIGPYGTVTITPVVLHICVPRFSGNRTRSAFRTTPYDPPLAFIAEEVIQSHAKYHGDAQQCGQSGKQLSPFQLRQQRGRKPGVPAQFHQSHALAQTPGAQFFANQIPSRAFGNRVGHASHGFFIKKITARYSKCTVQKATPPADVASEILSRGTTVAASS